ncbi:hypothetical protein Q5752_006042 [Cryptotrichosporon argae]
MGGHVFGTVAERLTTAQLDALTPRVRPSLLGVFARAERLPFLGDKARHDDLDLVSAWAAYDELQVRGCVRGAVAAAAWGNNGSKKWAGAAGWARDVARRAGAHEFDFNGAFLFLRMSCNVVEPDKPGFFQVATASSFPRPDLPTYDAELAVVRKQIEDTQAAQKRRAINRVRQTRKAAAE